MAWLISYFTERTHLVELEYYDTQYELKATSYPFTSHQGIPQDSICWPPNFYNLHKLFSYFKSWWQKTIMFADDTTIISHVATTNNIAK